VEALRAELGAGRLAREAVDALVAALDGSAAQVPVSWPRGLSDREVEVLRLVALGKSNAEAGQVLGISPKTVKNHVANLYAKIGVYSRAGAALFATEHGLLR
jgi:DNA-binding NarL/FixJ family response regulator